MLPAALVFVPLWRVLRSFQWSYNSRDWWRSWGGTQGREREGVKGVTRPHIVRDILRVSAERDRGYLWRSSWIIITIGLGLAGIVERHCADFCGSDSKLVIRRLSSAMTLEWFHWGQWPWVLKYEPEGDRTQFDWCRKQGQLWSVFVKTSGFFCFVLFCCNSLVKAAWVSSLNIDYCWSVQPSKMDLALLDNSHCDRLRTKELKKIFQVLTRIKSKSYGLLCKAFLFRGSKSHTVSLQSVVFAFQSIPSCQIRNWKNSSLWTSFGRTTSLLLLATLHLGQTHWKHLQQDLW